MSIFSARRDLIHPPGRGQHGRPRPLVRSSTTTLFRSIRRLFVKMHVEIYETISNIMIELHTEK